MDIVVDTSAIMAVIINEAQREILIDLTRGANLLAPASVHWEIGNAFSAMLRRKRITLAEALEAIRIYHRIPLRMVEVELQEALKIAAQAGIYAYDAYLIQCAQKYRTPLLSLDAGLVKVAEAMGVAVIKVETGR